MVPLPVTETLREFGVKNFTGVSGGCINNGGKLETAAGIFFIKWNSASRYPRMFETEARGLITLTSADAIHIPKVIRHGIAGDLQYIVLEWIEQKDRDRNYWTFLGEQLAALHQHSHSRFGLPYNNYIGSLPQQNTLTNTWKEFFLVSRLNPQLELLRVDASLRKKFDLLIEKLDGLFPDEKPGLIHGDLWSGNILVDEKGEPCLIDPAICYGHREMEIAFTRLFGGFDQSFYAAYHASFPLVPGFSERMDIYNLYPLLVHANLFGGGYLQQVNAILRRFV